MEPTFLIVLVALTSATALGQGLPRRIERVMSSPEPFRKETPTGRTTMDAQVVHIFGEFLLPQAMWRDDPNDPAPWESPFNGTLTDPDKTVAVPYDFTQTIPTSGTYYWVRLDTNAQSGYETWRILYQSPPDPDGTAVQVIKSVKRHYNWYTPNGSPTFVTSS